MKAGIYILLALWFAMIVAFAFGCLILGWRTFFGAHPIPRSSEKGGLLVFFSAFPKIMKILWWTILAFTIVGAIINSIRSS